MIELQKQYNEHINKINQAEKYLVNNIGKLEIAEYSRKWIDALDESQKLIEEIEKQLERKTTAKERLEGFEED